MDDYSRIEYIGTWTELESRGFKRHKDDYIDCYEKKVNDRWWNLVSIDYESKDIVVYIERVGVWIFEDEYKYLTYYEDIKSLIEDNLVREVID